MGERMKGARSIRSVVTAAVVAFGILIGIGIICLAQQRRVTPIRDILSYPAQYRDSLVTISGVAVGRPHSPLRYKPYQIADESASITVIAIGFSPAIGDRVRVTGW
jgi:hypothetical protein